MPSLRQEIDAITADRAAVDRQSPGFFWGDNGRKLARAEAEVFGIAYADFLRMITVWEAWLDFLGLTMEGPLFHSGEAIAQERARHPDLTDARDLDQFRDFATQVGGLSLRQAEAIYWKDWFWTVRAGHVIYPDEADIAEPNDEGSLEHWEGRSR